MTEGGFLCSLREMDYYKQISFKDIRRIRAKWGRVRRWKIRSGKYKGYNLKEMYSTEDGRDELVILELTDHEGKRELNSRRLEYEELQNFMLWTKSEEGKKHLKWLYVKHKLSQKKKKRLAKTDAKRMEATLEMQAKHFVPTVKAERVSLAPGVVKRVRSQDESN